MNTPYTAPMSAPDFAQVPLTAIVSSPHNPRKSFNQDKLSELASTIKASGVHTPILLRYLPPARLQETFADRKKNAKLPEYEIVAGERRYRASLMAGMTTIPALIRGMTDEQALEVMFVENLQRDDLSELEEAEGYQQLCELTNISKDALGDKIGRSRRYVYDRLRLLKLQPLARTALRDGKISATAALAIAAVHDGDLQAKALAHATSNNFNGDQPSTRDLQRWMRQNVMLDLSRATFDIKLADLSPSAGACTSCPKRTGADPDLFAETQGPDMCCDAPCYHQKSEATRQASLDKFKAQGIKIIDGDEAEEIHMYSDRFDGYSPVSQTREDTASGKPATLLDLLGKKGQTAVGLVAIEHPTTKTVQAYVDADKAEAWLLANGLVVAADVKLKGKAYSSYNAESALKRLLESRDTRVKAAGDEATQNAVQHAVLHAAPRLVNNALLTDLFLRAYLTAHVNPYAPGILAEAMHCDRDNVNSNDYRDKLEGHIYRAERSVLMRAFILVLLDQAQDNLDSDVATGLLLDAESDLHETLSKDDAPSLADICTAAEQAENAAIDAEVETLKAQIAPKPKPKKAPVPNAPLARPNKSAEAKPKKAKLTKQEAQLGIADAMQGMEEVAADAAKPTTFAAGQRVKTLAADALRPVVGRFAGLCGTVTSTVDDECTVKLDKGGRGGGVRTFTVTELEAA